MACISSYYSTLNSVMGTRTNPNSLAQIKFSAFSVLATQSFDTVSLRTFWFSNGVYTISNDGLDGIQNNLFTFTEDAIQYTITIPPANYDIISLLGYLQTEMDTLTGNTHTFIYDPTTFKVEFRTTGTTCSFDFTDIKSPFLELGFSYGSTPILISAGSYLTVTSTSCIQISTPQDLFIYIPELNATHDVLYVGETPFHFQIPIKYNAPQEINWDYLVDGPKSILRLGSSMLSNLTTLTFNLYVMRYGRLYKLNMDANAAYTFCLKFDLYIK